MELAYNHPVVHAFVKTVMESIQKRKVQRRKEAHSDDIAVVEANQFAPAGERWNTVECIRPKECSLRIMSRPEYWIAIANVCKSQGQIRGGGGVLGVRPPPSPLLAGLKYFHPSHPNLSWNHWTLYYLHPCTYVWDGTSQVTVCACEAEL